MPSLELSSTLPSRGSHWMCAMSHFDDVAGTNDCDNIKTMNELDRRLQDTDTTDWDQTEELGEMDEDEDDVLQEGILRPEQAVFQDNTHGTSTDEECFSLKLLLLMRKINAPHYAYRDNDSNLNLFVQS
jgi:hypothetical protein